MASPVDEAVASEPDAAEYPERHWIAQSVWHGDGVRLATAAFHHHFNDQDNVLVAMELVVYYERGNHPARLRPDVQAAFDVKRAGNCSTFKRCLGKARHRTLVLEVALPSTAGTMHGTRRRSTWGSGCVSTGGSIRQRR